MCTIFFLSVHIPVYSCVSCVFVYPEDPRVFWLVTGFMFLGSGLIWRRLLSFLGRHLEPAAPTLVTQTFLILIFISYNNGFLYHATRAIKSLLSLHVDVWGKFYSIIVKLQLNEWLKPWFSFPLFVIQIPPVWKRNLKTSDMKAGVRWCSTSAL